GPWRRVGVVHLVAVRIEHHVGSERLVAIANVRRLANLAVRIDEIPLLVRCAAQERRAEKRRQENERDSEDRMSKCHDVSLTFHHRSPARVTPTSMPAFVWGIRQEMSRWAVMSPHRSMRTGVD